MIKNTLPEASEMLQRAKEVRKSEGLLYCAMVKTRELIHDAFSDGDTSFTHEYESPQIIESMKSFLRERGYYVEESHCHRNTLRVSLFPE